MKLLTRLLSALPCYSLPPYHPLSSNNSLSTLLSNKHSLCSSLIRQTESDGKLSYCLSHDLFRCDLIVDVHSVMQDNLVELSDEGCLVAIPRLS
jgi:hypothetical protein